MNLTIELDGNDIKLVLKDGRKIIDSFAWFGEHSLSEHLLPNIDKLLKKNRISKEEIEKLSAKISKVSGVTSARIVKTVVKAWEAGKKHSV
ncbi:MAG TPA: hypothetical protein VF817_02270 [Patescibacteria group bacterium]